MTKSISRNNSKEFISNLIEFFHLENHKPINTLLHPEPIQRTTHTAQLTMTSTTPGSQPNEADTNQTYKDQLDQTAQKVKYGTQDGSGGIASQVAEKGGVHRLRLYQTISYMYNTTNY